MTDLRKSAEMAIEALEGVVKNCWRDIPSWRLDEIKEQSAALRTALAQPEKLHGPSWQIEFSDGKQAGIKAALAQPEQVSISRCKQCGGALPVTGALNKTGECDCIGQLKVISTIAWFNAPVKTEWGEDMMCASISIDNDHTLTLYCERSQIHKVPTILKELP